MWCRALAHGRGRPILFASIGGPFLWTDGMDSASVEPSSPLACRSEIYDVNGVIAHLIRRLAHRGSSPRCVSMDVDAQPVDANKLGASLAPRGYRLHDREQFLAT